MGLTINEKFQNLIPPQQPCEYQILEENILRDGCTTPLDVWPHDGKVELLDGHHRYEICKKHSIPYETHEVYLGSEEDAQIWIIRNQFGRRNLTNYQRAELSFALEPLIAAKARANQSIAGGDKKSCSAKSLSPKCEKAVEAIHTDEELAKLSGISRNTIRRAKVIKEHGTTEQIERARKGGNGNSVNAIYTEIRHKDATEKTCPMCGKTLPINRFYGEGATCKTCTETRKRVLLAGGEVSYKKGAKPPVLAEEPMDGSIGEPHPCPIPKRETPGKPGIDAVDKVSFDLRDKDRDVIHTVDDLLEDLESIANDFKGKFKRSMVNSSTILQSKEGRERINSVLDGVQKYILELKAMIS